jgi:hypothetical protein
MSSVKKLLDTTGYCVSCGASVKGTFKYCYLCNISDKKVKCDGWINEPCSNYTTNQIHRCIKHCLNFCVDECIGRRVATIIHLNDNCCKPLYCIGCKKPLFDSRYKKCYNCSSRRQNKKIEDSEDEYYED